MIISTYINKFFKTTLFTLLCFGMPVNAQQQLQKIGFVDIEYVLNKIPSYAGAQTKLNTETTTWKKNLDKMYLKLNTMKEEFLNEKPLLTEDLVKEREIEIKNYEEEIIKVENTYFGTEGKLFDLRKKLVTPYQDLVFNAVQTIAKIRKYDMIFEKSSSIVMLYTNNNYDISELVLKYIQKSKKEIEQEEAAIKREIAKKAREKRIADQRKKREEDRIKRENERKKRNNK
ncbi:MAG: OmpH family outer membrane protein [Wenyingzhuangia sp.]